MKQIYSNALSLLNRRAKQCGTALACSTDEYSLAYWRKELAIANFKIVKIEQRYNKRYKSSHNVIHVDFNIKKRKAA